MARMIPPLFPQDAPPGERALYSALAESAGTDDWVVLHSLGIAKHVRNPEGEADFVIVAPHLGVLVIEVKSHSHINFEQGTWHLGNQKPTTRGPFKQASEAKYSLRNLLEKKQVALRSIPTLSAAWFTGVRARSMLPSSSEWHPWEVLDSEDLKKDPVAAIRRTFHSGLAHLDDCFPGFSFRGVGPDAETAKKIVHVMRPNFDIGVAAGDMRQARNRLLIHFVEEQYMALDSMAANRSVLFTGPAGSGKTLLAVEATRRELSMGKRGRLICFNRLLGKRLKSDMPDGPNLVVGTLHQQMLSLTGMKVPYQAEDSFWKKELPERAVEVLLEAGESIREDFLIVDEVQDLLTGEYADVLDLWVKGGLSSGRVLMFGDFERQALFAETDGLTLLRSRVPHLTSNRLTMNCRNLPRIGHTVNLFSGLDPGYRKFRREDDGANPVWLKYKRGDDQTGSLKQAIGALKADGYSLDEILVLSPLGSRSVAASSTDPWLRQILKPADGNEPKRGELLYSTIHAIKGLDAPAVIVTDLDRELVPDFESILYVGLTRATDRLFGIVEETTGLSSMKGQS